MESGDYVFMDMTSFEETRLTSEQIGKEFLNIAYGSFNRLPLGRLAIAGLIHGELKENRIVIRARMQIFFAMLILCFA